GRHVVAVAGKLERGQFLAGGQVPGLHMAVRRAVADVEAVDRQRLALRREGQRPRQRVLEVALAQRGGLFLAGPGPESHFAFGRQGGERAAVRRERQGDDLFGQSLERVDALAGGEVPGRQGFARRLGDDDGAVRRQGQRADRVRKGRDLEQ